MYCHLLWKHRKSLLGFCLSKSPAPFALVGKASALICGSVIPKMCETTLSVKQGMQAHIWRHLRRCWSATSRAHFPSRRSWMTRRRSSPPLRAGRVMKNFDKWKVLLQGFTENLPLEDCEFWFLAKCPTSQEKLSQTEGCWGTLWLEIMRRTCTCSESWKVAEKNN